MRNFPKLMNYISELDSFFHDYESSRIAPTESQRREILKHQRIKAIRDAKTPDAAPQRLWEKF